MVPYQPFVEIQFDANSDMNQEKAEKVVESLQLEIDKLFKSLGGTLTYPDTPIQIEIHPRTDFIARTDKQRKSARQAECGLGTLSWKGN